MNLITRLKAFLRYVRFDMYTERDIPPEDFPILHPDEEEETHPFKPPCFCPFCKRDFPDFLLDRHMQTCGRKEAAAFVEAVEALDFPDDEEDTRPIYHWDNPEESYREDPRDKNSQWGEPF